MTTPSLFDRRALRRNRARAAAFGPRGCFLAAEVACRLEERLADIKRTFTRALVLGPPDLIAPPAKAVVRADLVAHDGKVDMVLDEEALPFGQASFDLVISLMGLHWVNDLPGALVQFNRALAPDGLFLAALCGAGTLERLRQAFLAAEAELEGGASPHVAPFAEVRDLGGLLSRAGFALPVADVDHIDVRYRDAFALMADLRGMGEANVMHNRRRAFARRATFLRMAQLYGEEEGAKDGAISARFSIVYLTGWAPAPGQPRPARPARLADALGTVEQSAGEKAAR
ncbi:MAG: methyltransferase domain-containing protein [Pseudomonadota bacterium]